MSNVQKADNIYNLITTYTLNVALRLITECLSCLWKNNSANNVKPATERLYLRNNLRLRLTELKAGSNG